MTAKDRILRLIRIQFKMFITRTHYLHACNKVFDEIVCHYDVREST